MAWIDGHAFSSLLTCHVLLLESSQPLSLAILSCAWPSDVSSLISKAQFESRLLFSELAIMEKEGNSTPDSVFSSSSEVVH